MAFEAEFLELMPHTITVYPVLSANTYGEPVFSTSGTTYQALVEERPQMIRSAFGEEMITSANAYVASTARIPLTSRVVLPDGSEPALVRSDVFADEDGTAHHVTLFFGSGARAGGGG